MTKAAGKGPSKGPSKGPPGPPGPPRPVGKGKAKGTASSELIKLTVRRMTGEELEVQAELLAMCKDEYI